MSIDYVTLMGADDVARAGSQMKEAADRMYQAANLIDERLTRHEQFLDEWAREFVSEMGVVMSR